MKNIVDIVINSFQVILALNFMRSLLIWEFFTLAINVTTKQLKRTIKSPNATKLVKAAMTACEPWVEIAEKLKAMKGDVVKRQVGVGTKKNPVPTGVLNKEIEEELEKIVNKLPLNSKDKKTYLNKLKLPKAPLNGITRNLKKFVKNANISNKKKETYITELK